MHIPSAQTKDMTVLGFGDALYEYEHMLHMDFSKDDWIYVPCKYDEYRYILGTRGKNPLICVGINPSTAEPGNLDNTLKSVDRIAAANGFDSFIMFNVYAQRATNPNDMDIIFNEKLHVENMRAFEYILENSLTSSIWAAWGTVIEKRPYLKNCVLDMIEVGEKHNARWYTAGKCSKAGHPHHPLYLKKDTVLDLFDINKYVNSI